MTQQFKHIEGTGKPLKVVAPVSNEGYTKGKEYPIIDGSVKPSKSKFKWSFNITNDLGYVAFCLERICSHIDERNWIVTERES